MKYHFANRMDNIQGTAVRDLLKYAEDPSIISFAGGFPDPAIFPIEELRQAFDQVMVEEGKTALQYSSSEGYLPLREKIAARMKKVDIECTSKNVFMVHGGQQGLDFTGKLFINEGDTIICEDPTFLGAIIAFGPYQPKYAGVKMDADGMIMEELEKALEAHPDAKFIYTIPDFQNPTGVSMSLERRKRLIELANQYDMVVIEDNPYREIRYEGEVLPSLKSFDTKGLVIHLGTFSKILAPGLRIGWVVAEEDIINQFGTLKQSADTHTNTLIQRLVNRYLENYDIDEHIETIRLLYKKKKDLMLSVMAETFPKNITWTKPQGGLFTWVTLPDGVDATAVLMRALKEAKVAFVPGAPFYPGGNDVHHFRVNYSGMSEAQIEEGIRRLGALLNRI